MTAQLLHLVEQGPSRMEELRLPVPRGVAEGGVPGTVMRESALKV